MNKVILPALIVFWLATGCELKEREVPESFDKEYYNQNGYLRVESSAFAYDTPDKPFDFDFTRTVSGADYTLEKSSSFEYTLTISGIYQGYGQDSLDPVNAALNLQFTFSGPSYPYDMAEYDNELKDFNQILEVNGNRHMINANSINNFYFEVEVINGEEFVGTLRVNYRDNQNNYNDQKLEFILSPLQGETFYSF